MIGGGRVTDSGQVNDGEAFLSVLRYIFLGFVVICFFELR